MNFFDERALIYQAGRFDLITTDVFDTILLRTLRSERSRIALGEAQFSAALLAYGFNVAPSALIQARLVAQKLGFRAIQATGKDGELKLVDVIERQLSILGIPLSYLEDRLQIEYEIETTSLVPNIRLAKLLRSLRGHGARICAVSDTTLPEAQIKNLISYFYGSDFVDAVYSSADVGLTKRGCGIFNHVHAAERFNKEKWLHIGDDKVADVSAPRLLGIQTFHTPRRKILSWLRRLDGLVATLKFRFSTPETPENYTTPQYIDRYSFGYSIFGPIVTQFCERIWLYASQASSTHRSVILFCSRGGIGIREAFELYVEKLNLSLDCRRENVMISRLAVARGACLGRSEAAAQELNREFLGERCCDVARFLGGCDYVLGKEWEDKFNAESFFNLIDSDSGNAVRRDIELQHILFSEHILSLVKEADRIILCDTGLYGSTQRLLVAAMPNLPIETIQFARANYKRHDEEHFSKVAGLVVESDLYNPFIPETCVLRFWHVVEQLFEPSIPSARTFAWDSSGEVIANCGDIRHGKIDPSSGNMLLKGCLDYVRTLSPHLARFQPGIALAATKQLRRAITRPSPVDLEALRFGARSIDFGRPQSVELISIPKHGSFLSKIAAIKSQYWREGAVVAHFPNFKYILLNVLSAIHIVRLTRYTWSKMRRGH